MFIIKLNSCGDGKTTQILTVYVWGVDTPCNSNPQNSHMFFRLKKALQFQGAFDRGQQEIFKRGRGSLDTY